MVDQRVRRAGLARTAGYATAVSVVVASFTLAPATSAAAKTKPFANGNATAIAQAFQIAPRTGGLSAAVTIGTVIADYRDTLAQASSQAASLGVIGTTLTTSCGSTNPVLKPSQLPQALIAESSEGNAHATKSTAGNGSLLQAGQETVSATTVPKSDAAFTGNGISIPGVLALSGMTTSSTSQLIKGQARVATATSQIGQLALAGGLISLNNMTWTVTQRTGSHPMKKTSFLIGSAKIAGISRPADEASVDALFLSINKLLGPTGLHITPPKQTTTGGVLAISPLVIGIDDSSIGAKVLDPAEQAVAAVNNSIGDLTDQINCTLGGAYGDTGLVEAALDGTGGLDADLGGASATSQAVNYANPFGGKLGGNSSGSNGSSTGSTGSTSGHTAPLSTGGGSSSLGTGSALPNPAASTGTSTGGGSQAPTLAGSHVVSESCSTISPAKRPACTDGQGFVVGMIALGALGAIGGTDFAITRRRRRLPKQALTL